MHKGYRCFNPGDQKIIISRNVVFDEMCFPFAEVIRTPPSAVNPSPATLGLSSPPIVAPCNMFSRQPLSMSNPTSNQPSAALIPSTPPLSKSNTSTLLCLFPSPLPNSPLLPPLHQLHPPLSPTLIQLWTAHAFIHLVTT